MRREGRQHGTVRIVACKLPPGHGPRTGAATAPAKANGGARAAQVMSCLQMQAESSPPAGAYARAPAKPTNHSKHSGKCKKAKCRECQHASAPASKSRDKAKGAHKLRSSDVLLNHRLASWRVADAGASPHPGFRGASASEILRQLSASRHSNDSDDLRAEDERCAELLYVYGEPPEYGYGDGDHAEEDVGYGHGEYDDGPDDMAVECVEPKREELAGPSSADDAEQDDDDDDDNDVDTDMDYFVVGVAWEYSDGEEDWLVVQEM